MSGLVERLRDRRFPYDSRAREVLDQAATALEAMEKEIAALRGRVKQAETCCDSYANENQKLHDRAETAERERDEARAARWNTFAKMPEPGRKFIALYNDGSGAAMFFAFDGGVIDSDGGEYYDWNPDDTLYDRWAYLPDNLEFWCEIRAEDPVCLRAAGED